MSPYRWNELIWIVFCYLLSCGLGEVRGQTEHFTKKLIKAVEYQSMQNEVEEIKQQENVAKLAKEREFHQHRKNAELNRRDLEFSQKLSLLKEDDEAFLNATKAESAFEDNSFSQTIADHVAKLEMMTTQHQNEMKADQKDLSKLLQQSLRESLMRLPVSRELPERENTAPVKQASRPKETSQKVGGTVAEEDRILASRPHQEALPATPRSCQPRLSAKRSIDTRILSIFGYDDNSCCGASRDCSEISPSCFPSGSQQDVCREHDKDLTGFSAWDVTNPKVNQAHERAAARSSPLIRFGLNSLRSLGNPDPPEVESWRRSGLPMYNVSSSPPEG